MKIKNGLAKIYEYGYGGYYAKIISSSKDYVVYMPVFCGYDYQGYCISITNRIYKIVHNSKTLSFYKTVLNDDVLQDGFDFVSPKQLIKYCFENNKCIEYSKRKWGHGCEDLFITNIGDTSFSGRPINRNGELKKEVSIDYDEVTFINFNTTKLTNLENYIYKKHQFAVSETKRNPIVEIYEYGSDSFLVGKIINSTKDNFLFFNNVSSVGDNSSWALLSTKTIYKIERSTKYVNFFFKTLSDKEPPFLCNEPKKFLEYCFENNRIIEMATYSTGDKVFFFSIINIKDNIVTGQVIGDYGERKRIKSIKISEISWLLYNSSYTKGIERFLSSNSKP